MKNKTRSLKRDVTTWKRRKASLLARHPIILPRKRCPDCGVPGCKGCADLFRQPALVEVFRDALN